MRENRVFRANVTGLLTAAIFAFAQMCAIRGFMDAPEVAPLVTAHDRHHDGKADAHEHVTPVGCADEACGDQSSNSGNCPRTNICCSTWTTGPARYSLPAPTLLKAFGPALSVLASWAALDRALTPSESRTLHDSAPPPLDIAASPVIGRAPPTA